MSTDRKITVTLKGGVGFDAPWVVIGGDTLDEVNYQLDQVLAAGTLQKAAQVAIAFHNGFRAGRHAAGDHGQEPPRETYTQPPAGAVPAPQQNQDSPSWDNWSSQRPPAQQDPWTGQQQPQQPPQQAQQGWGQQTQQNAAPGGAPICQCGQIMEHKTTGGGKPVWRCKDWRWNNGNPSTNHDQIWVEGH